MEGKTLNALPTTTYLMLTALLLSFFRKIYNMLIEKPHRFFN